MKKKQHFSKKKEKSTPNSAQSKHRKVFKKAAVRRDFSNNLGNTPGKKWAEYRKEEATPNSAQSKHGKVFNKAAVRRDFSLNLAITPGKKWVEYRTDFESQSVQSTTSVDVISSLKMEAQNFIIADSKLYKKYNEKRKEKADFAWINTILYSGTISDKISSHVLLIQDSAVYNSSSIEILVGMVNIKGKRECLLVMDCLRDLFLSDLLVEDRKLKFFDQQPLMQLDELTGGNSDTRKKHLIAWFFEDKLKSIYGTFLKNLELVSHDIVEKTKQKAVSVMYELMKCNPEQEQFLLERIVNKVGDPMKKVCAHVCFLLGQLVDCHPNMKYIVAQEVERLLFRPKVSERTKYYCLCFLNQLIFTSDDKKLATRLIMIYFSLFKICTKKGEVNTKMMSALLSGVSRAYPFASLEESVFHEQLNNMYKLVHVVSFNISIQALMLIFQVLNSKDSISDRFYCTLYRKLFDPAIGSSSRQSMLLNLVHRALKKDVAGKRVRAFVKRLLQISMYQAPHLQCGILYVISEIAKIHTDLLNNLVSAFELDSDEEEHYEDVVDDDDKILSENEVPSSNLIQSEAENLKNCPSSWVHKEIQKPTKSSYDPQCRNPLHAGAEYCNLWELRYLKNCFHPSVSLFAHQVSARNEIKYSGDPLQDFTLIRFLDRFVYRNPKKVPEIGVPDKHRKIFGSRGLYTPIGIRNMAVTSDAYLNQKVENVPAEEDFIFRFLRQKMTDGKLKKGDDFDIESVNSDEFEGLLEKYNVADEGEDALDFVKELTEQKKSGKKRKEDPSNEEMEDDFDSLEGDSDMDEPDFEDDEDFQKAFEDFDEEFEDTNKANDTFAFEDEYALEDGDLPHKRSKAERRKPKSLKSLDPESLFASADEFATLLEDNNNSNIDNSTADAFINKDKSDAKQILWERQRDRHVKGKDWRRQKGQKFRNKSGFKGNKWF